MSRAAFTVAPPTRVVRATSGKGKTRQQSNTDEQQQRKSGGCSSVELEQDERERKILMFGVLDFFISRGLGFHGVRRYKKEIRGLGSNLTDQKKGGTLEFIFQNKPTILKDGNPTSVFYLGQIPLN